MLNIKIALYLLVLTNYSYSSSLQSQLKSYKFDPFIKNLNRVYDSTCGNDCQRCADKMEVYVEEISATCETYSYDGSNKDFCFALYMSSKCYKEFARKYCERCDEFNAFEKYVNDFIISIENGICSNYPSQPCDSSTITTSTTIAGSTNLTTPSYPFPSTATATATATRPESTTVTQPESTTATRPESTTAKDNCDSQCNCNCNCNFNLVPQQNNSLH